MSFASHDSTPNQGLGATSQATRELGDSQKFSEKRDASRLSPKSKQLSLWESPQNPVSETELFRHKPQIVSTPGVCFKERCRYRVILGAEVLGERLTLDEAIALANQSTHL